MNRAQAIKQLTDLAETVAAEWMNGTSIPYAGDALRVLGVDDDELPVDFRSDDYWDAKDRAEEESEKRAAFLGEQVREASEHGLYESTAEMGETR